MRTVDIPGGQATLRTKLKQRHRQRLEDATVLAGPAIQKFRDRMPEGADPQKMNLIDVGLSREDLATMHELQHTTILTYLVGWTLLDENGQPLPLPETADDLGDLDVDVYDALRVATASDGADVAAPVDFSASPDPDSPIVPSGGSEMPLRDEPASQSTETLPVDGASSAIDAPSEV